ncbi:MAG: peptidase C11 [Oscillospiraceae bacterium]|nr:peptidase C11 [Oscillospiraceae bacterium]
MDQNRPKGREKHVTSGGSGVHRRGDGLGTGPVGSQNGYAGRQESGGGHGKRAAAAGGGGTILLLVLVFLMLKGCGGGLGNLGGGGGGTADLTELLGGGGGDLPYHSGQQQEEQHVVPDSTPVDNTVASGSRDKRTKILGNNQDTVTVMLYVCGTDLESKSGMASSDLGEIASATYGDNVNVIVYTGGCAGWRTQGISSQVNQIYRVRNQQLERLEADMGNKPMTDPATLSEFIRYCSKNFPANRNELIFWDHGGGSVTGYGYDEKLRNGGSMDLGGISQALRDGGVTFDFVGFDACLMATAETALMLNDYADYMVASEETEPGIGWYYTNWVTKLGENTSMPTVEIGKLICDDFTSACARKCPGQQTTLSVIDLAEFSNTVPDKLSAFAQSVSGLMEKKEYQQVSDARYGTREFASSNRIDQVDLTHLALNMKTSEGKALAETLQKAVKYNRTSSNMTNAYGVSIFFPYRNSKYVAPACSTYNQINMNSAYTKCIRQFASLQTSGQIASGGSGSPLESLFGMGGSSGGAAGADMIGSLLSGFLSSGMAGGKSIAGLDSSNIDFMNDLPMSQDEVAQYISMNQLPKDSLTWFEENGQYKMTLSKDQWKLVEKVDKNVFYDDGSGYVDLGLDNVYDFDDKGNLLADTDRTWLAINGQVVAYYHMNTVTNGDDYRIDGYVPCMLNGERAKLLLVFDQDHKYGFISGAETDYHNNETETVAKSFTELTPGDKLEFVCDYYSYDGQYQDSYYLGDEMTVTDKMEISNVNVGDGAISIMYLFTDIYNNETWSDKIVQ